MKRIKKRNQQSTAVEVSNKSSVLIGMDYESLFLLKNNLTQRKSIYLADEVRDKVSQVVMAMRNREMTAGMYIENIILHHLQTYKDEINTLCEQKYKKPL